MKSINFVILGKDIASEFGKKGLESDLAFYDRKESDVIRTWVVPSGFPDKIQPLFQAINLSEYVIFHVDKLDRFVGEQIIALDVLKKDKGILSHTFDVDESKLDSMIKGTIVENYIRVNQDNIKEEAAKLEPITDNSDTAEILVDHCMDIKGAGTVILGKITGGRIRQYDELTIYPHKVNVTIKSIQMHDNPVSESEYPARVGLAVKGIRPDMVGRGDIISSESMDTRTEIELDFQKSPFYKTNIAVNQGCLVNVGLQIKAAKFAAISPLKLTFEKPIICKKGQIAVVLKPESSTIRILGSGTII